MSKDAAQMKDSVQVVLTKGDAGDEQQPPAQVSSEGEQQHDS